MSSKPPYGTGSSDPRLPMNRKSQKKPEMTEAQIKHMVDRFLGWELPENFTPDGGVSFARQRNLHHAVGAPPFYPMPLGTNLFDAEQASAMVRHMIEGLPKATE